MDVSPSALKHLIIKDFFFLSRQTRKNEIVGEEEEGGGISGRGRRGGWAP